MKNPDREKRFIIPIFITHQGCPHRCVFCNQETTTGWGGGLPSVDQVQRRIVSFLRTMEGRTGRREVAFYGGTFTALSLGDQESLLRAVQPFLEGKSLDAVRVSTRPDAIDSNRLSLLRRYSVQTVELGAQSMVDEILWNCRRGHTSGDVVGSARLTRSMGFEVGIQIMLGLPGETKDLFLTTVRRVVDLTPQCVRIYPLLVLKGSPLERLYRRGKYSPISLTEAVQWAREALRLLEKAEIPVIRLGLQASPELEASEAIVAGPYHPAFRTLVESSIFYDMACRLLDGWGEGHRDTARFRIAPADVSYFTGQRKENLTRLKEAYGFRSIEIGSDADIIRGGLILEDSRGKQRVAVRWDGQVGA